MYVEEDVYHPRPKIKGLEREISRGEFSTLYHPPPRAAGSSLAENDRVDARFCNEH